jgi:Putative zinc-finger
VTTFPPPQAPTPDPAELLSAYLDGELTPEEEAEVRALLASSPEHQTELASLEEARTWVRGLGPVEPPEGFLDEVIATVGRPVQKPKKWGMLNVVATAAVWVAVLGFVNMNKSDDVQPEVANLVSNHTAASVGVGGFLGSLGGGEPEPQAQTRGTPPPPESDVGKPYWVPTELPGELALVSATVSDDVVTLSYSNGVEVVTILEQPGHLDTNALPPATPVEVGGVQGWQVDSDRATAIVVERDNMVYVVVGHRDGGLVEAVAAEFPEPPSPSLAERLGEAGRSLLDSFGLG